MVKIMASGVLGVILLSGCGQPRSQNSVPKAQVSADQAQDAFGIVYDIKYLPFAYAEDGCYARSLYMSMELAVQGIPSSAHYIYGDLHPNADIAWSYHVAPLLKLDEQEPWILDPSLETRPLRLSDWIGKNFPSGSYRTEIKAGSAYFDSTGRTSKFNNARMIQNFEEMPAFLIRDITDACEVMFDYLEREGINPEGKQDLLIRRTQFMIEQLKSVGKLSVSAAISRGVCAQR